MSDQLEEAAKELARLNMVNRRRGVRGRGRSLSAAEAVDMVAEALRPFFARTPPDAPVPLLLWCPECHVRHVDRGTFKTRPHHTHACQNCGHVWRPAVVATVGVQYLPGFLDVGGA